jgi:hypothetical protein
MNAVPLRRVCAWCSGIMDLGGPVVAGEMVSHGMCGPCFSRESALFMGSSSGLRRADFPQVSGAGRTAGDNDAAAGAMPTCKRSREAISP